MGGLGEVRRELRKNASPQRAKALQRFFKTGPGEYAEGDIFLGLTAPITRKIVKQFQDLSLSDSIKLLHSRIHEERTLALLIMACQFDKPDNDAKEKIYKAYLANTKFINNWDLVDLTAPTIVGGFLVQKDRGILYKLAKSNSLWERRIAVLATYNFIKLDDFKDAIKIIGLLTGDTEDLIHKACGWMLREVGKRNVAVEEDFLRKNCMVMPRTMLRYAIEKFPEKRRKEFLSFKH